MNENVGREVERPWGKTDRHWGRGEMMWDFLAINHGCIIGGKIEIWGSCMRLCMYKQYLPYRDLPWGCAEK